MGLVAVAVVLHLRRRWVPLGDNALTQLWTGAVGGSGTPLVGGDSRFGWNHLGPWLFYLLAIPYRLLARSPRGLLLGAGLVNVVSLAMIRRCVRCVAGEAAAVFVTIGAALFVLSAGGARLVDPWNPYVVLLPFLLAVVACWAVVCHRWQWLPWLVGAGSLCIQSHIAYLPPVVALMLLASAQLVRHRRDVLPRPVLTAVVVAFVAWLPAAIDLALPRGHNLAHVLKFFFASSSKPVAGARSGIDVVLRETGLRGSWLGGRVPVSIFARAFDGALGLAPGLGLLALLLAAVIAARGRNRTAGSLVTIVAVLLVVGVVEMAATRGPLYPYLFGWVGVVAMLCWLAVPFALTDRISRPGLVDIGRVVAVALCVALLVSSVGAAQPRSPLERSEDAALVDRLVAATTQRLDRHQAYRLVHGNDVFNSIYEHGIAVQLVEQGFHLCVPRNLGFLFGRRFVNDHADDLAAIEVVAPYRGPRSAADVVVLFDPLSPSERAEEIQLTDKLVADYTSSGSPTAADIVSRVENGDVALAGFFVAQSSEDQTALARLAALRDRGRSVAVLLIPPPETVGQRPASTPLFDGGGQQHAR